MMALAVCACSTHTIVRTLGMGEIEIVHLGLHKVKLESNQHLSFALFPFCNTVGFPHLLHFPLIVSESSFLGGHLSLVALQCSGCQQTLTTLPKDGGAVKCFVKWLVGHGKLFRFAQSCTLTEVCSSGIHFFFFTPWCPNLFELITLLQNLPVNVQWGCQPQPSAINLGTWAPREKGWRMVHLEFLQVVHSG